MIETSSLSPKARLDTAIFTVLLTLFLVGLGHIAVGYARRGLAWIGVVIAGNLLSLGLLCEPRYLVFALVFVPLCVVLSVALLVDAYRCGRRPQGVLKWPTWRRIAVALIVLLCLPIVSPNSLMAQWGADYFRRNHAVTFTVSGRSMSPALLPGDSFIAHRNSTLSRWSIVVFEHAENRSDATVSRIVGLPNERIEVVDGSLQIDGRMIQPPNGAGPYTCLRYSGAQNRSLAGMPTVGCPSTVIQLTENEYFVLGDNSPLAFDARLWETRIDAHQRGALPGEFITGRVTAVYWPPNRWQIVK